MGLPRQEGALFKSLFPALEREVEGARLPAMMAVLLVLVMAAVVITLLLMEMVVLVMMLVIMVFGW